MNNIVLKRETRILDNLVNDYLSFEIVTKVAFTYNKLVIIWYRKCLRTLSAVLNIFEYSLKFNISAEFVTYLKCKQDKQISLPELLLIFIINV